MAQKQNHNTETTPDSTSETMQIPMGRLWITEEMNLQLYQGFKDAQAENERSKDKLERLGQEKRELEVEKARLQGKNSELSKLKAILDSGLTRLDLEALQENTELTAEQHALLESIQAQNKTNETLQAEIQAQKAKAALFKSLEEDLDAEVETSKQSMAELQARLGSAADALELAKDEPFADGTSVRALLDEATQKLDQAESRLGAIIKLRERINANVDKAIGSTGTIPVSDEYGGSSDGVSMGSAAADK